MKRWMVLVIALVGLAAVAGDAPMTPDGRMVYQKVIETPGISKAELMARARAWSAATWNRADKAVQLDDEEAGKFVARGRLPDGMLFTTTIEAKDGRYRYTLDGFQMYGWSFELALENGKPRFGYKKIWREFEMMIRRYQGDLIAAMEKPSPTSDQSW